MVQESGNQVLDGLYCLCKLCGELALATATPTASLKDSWDDTLTDIDQDGPGCKVGTLKFQLQVVLFIYNECMIVFSCKTLK